MFLMNLSIAILLLSFCAIHVKAQQSRPNSIEWSFTTPLPAAPGEPAQVGLAGVMGGMHNTALLVAGGSNFPERMPWEGGQKKYWDEIYVLLKDDAGGANYQWHDKSFKLPVPLAYAASATTEAGILLIGGENEEGIHSVVYLVSWDALKMEVSVKTMPSLPLPLTNAAAAVIGNQVFVVGGETTGGASDKVFHLDLALPHAWEKQAPLPLALSHAVAVTQSNGEYPCLYVIGARTQTSSGISELHASTFQFDPRKNAWTVLNNISDSAGTQTTLSAATGLAVGANYILVFGGDKGDVFRRIQQYNVNIENAGNEEIKLQLQGEKVALLNAHPGFSRDIYMFNTVTNEWTTVGTLPASHVTTFAAQWGNDILIPSGEIKPGVRTPAVLKGSMQQLQYFSWLDFAVVILYFLLMVGVGIWASRNQGTTDDYFRGGQRIPGWAAGLSIYGTQLSAITFMAIPAKTYATNWSYFFLQLTIIMVIPVITNYFIPFYRKLHVTSAYEYLERRFNYVARALASSLYIMLQFGRLAIVLLLPSLALTLVTGIDVNLCILVMGAITIFYTMKGGIEAVVWTDVAQVVILLGGALACLVMIPLNLNQDATTIWETIQAEDKLHLIDATFSLNTPTLWVVLIGGFAINVITYGADQSVIQRYLTTKNAEEAKKSMRLGAWMALPSTLIFFSMGTLLYLFYKEYPDRVNYQLQSQDAIFPWFIVTELPSGLVGLLIAAIFAAAMSTLSSSMNSVTTAIVTDFYRRLSPYQAEARYLTLAKYLTLVIGAVGTVLALLMASVGVSSLWDQFNMLLGLFTGGLGGLFILGIFTKRANAKGSVAGLFFSALIQYYVSTYTGINLLMYAFTGLFSCVTFGYLFSLLLGRQKKDIEGLTIHEDKVSEKRNVLI
jgi:SSS family solute:Na+ symporter